MMEKGEFGTPEHAPAPNYEQLAGEAFSYAKKVIQEKYENNKDHPEDYRDYHNVKHTENVRDRAGMIMRAIKDADDQSISDKEISLGLIAASFHDIELGQKIIPKEIHGYKIKMRVPEPTVSGEEESAKIAAKWMQEHGLSAVEDADLVMDAIRATTTGTIDRDEDDSDYTGPIIVQENLGPESSLVALSLALADMGTLGMEGKEAFTKQGNNLFRENNPGIREFFNDMKGSGRSWDDHPLRDTIHRRMVKWAQGQEYFAKDRFALFDMTLENSQLSDDAKQAVRNLFPTFNPEKFKEVINDIHQDAVDIQNETSIKELLGRFDYVD